MTVRYGFYNSVAQDRKYDAIDFDMMFDGVLIDGVFENVGDHLRVLAETGLYVSAGIGRAWFNFSWTYNDAALLLQIAAADLYLPRIDAVIIEIDTGAGVRANSIKVLTGTPASSPVPPTLTNSGTLHQYPLAYVLVPANATQILQGNITDKIGTVDCPFATVVIGPKKILASNIADAVITHDQIAAAAGILGSQLDSAAGIVNAQLADDTITEAKISETAGIKGSQLADNTITEAKISETAGIKGTQLAADAGITGGQVEELTLTDANMSDRISVFWGRKGGSPTAWSTPGSTDYSITGRVKIKVGVVQITILNGQNYRQETITFPAGEGNFTVTPMVFVSNEDISGQITNVSAYADSTGSCVITVERNNTGAQHSTTVYWMAMGQ